MTGGRIWALHLAVLVALLAAGLLLPGYHSTNLARILVLATFALGYNLAFGYTGLLSLGHAMFFAAGMYGAGLPAWHWGWEAGPALLTGAAAGGLLALLAGSLALRTAGVSFMIVTLMFAQAFALSLLYFSDWTGGDDGFAVPTTARLVFGHALSADVPRFLAAWGVFALGLVIALALVCSRFGRVMVALRENEERARMLGINPYRAKLQVLVISGIYSGVAGAAYALLFGYVGSSFASIQYSILPMLYVLLGGAGTVLGGVIGAAGIFYLTEWATALTSAWLFLVGLALVVLVLFLPKGVLGWVRAKLWRNLP
ncbi:branched-chain amino acid ABC transporter permease [Xinfangfangia sp. CPCC 101601]|uniref:Branched-chain amino acid ABC transporter permease n=1 Tax=Pseudogemmobacter lacusdianii TaxID=3069608 RepID=A0ABU0W0W0_9RHOB|nr:branched-chain amino acid ABC transporter permease [Xinfangfangia sp. CPCC 101601]MDQ2067651.1 branched-chain amino acid ABC transporter permease [Xinfangfangia sp. CPCC 101601]